ncbi:Protein NRT1/ PTR FAMILY 1.2, partial [Cucurbita argyrosperma subsp. argyrosperma]
MEGPLAADEDRDMEEPLLSNSDRKGGLRALPFIIANGALERLASQGLSPSMILYLTRVYGMNSANASNVIFLWSAASNFTPIICAFLADSYFGRFRMIAAGCIISCLGMFVLWLTAMIPQARPFCDGAICDTPSIAQLLFLYSSYALMSMGSGCLQSSNLAFGANQLHRKNKSNSGILDRYFDLYYVSSASGSLIGVSCIVYIQDRMGWRVGFGVPVALMLLSTVIFLLASPLYLKPMPSSSWCAGLVQVFVAAYKKRHLQVSSTGTSEMYHHKSGSPLAMPSDKLRGSLGLLQMVSEPNTGNVPSVRGWITRFKIVRLTVILNGPKRTISASGGYKWYQSQTPGDVPARTLAPKGGGLFLNKACIIRNSEDELASDGRASNPWILCTVEQVEDLKTLIRIMALWSTGILVCAALSQPFYVLQVASMDRHLTPTFEVPAGSFGAVFVVSLILWIMLYDRLILPLVSSCRGKPTRLSGKTRMGIGILLCTFSLAVTAVVESNRRALAIKEGFSDDPDAVVNMSAFWTLPRYILLGMAEAFNVIGQIEFFYYELPKAMSSVATSLFGLSMSVGNLAASFIVTIVDNFTKAAGVKSWVSSNINQGHSDYYYWLLFGLLFANFLYFLACSKSYGPSKEEARGGSNAEDDLNNTNKIRGSIEFNPTGLLPNRRYVTVEIPARNQRRSSRLFELMEVLEDGEKTGIAASGSEGAEQASNYTNGGLKTMPFIIVNETFERVASLGLTPNMVFYLRDVFGFEIAAASIILSLWSAASNALAIVGAVLADSYLGRFCVIILGSCSSLLVRLVDYRKLTVSNSIDVVVCRVGMILLWLTAIIPQLRPESCSPSGILCDSANPYQLAVLFSSLVFISIGAGCIRPCSVAFGADQLTKEEKPNNESVLDSYFNWYYASIGIATIVALSLIVFIQDKFGWGIGFAVPAVLMLFSVLIFLVGSSLYVKVKPTQSLLTGFLRVIVVAFKNRKLSLPFSNFDQYYLGRDPKCRIPTNSMRLLQMVSEPDTGRCASEDAGLSRGWIAVTNGIRARHWALKRADCGIPRRYLNKACLIKDAKNNLNPDGSVSNPWNLCSVDQVESLKAFLRIIPMWSTGILMLVCLNQNSFGTIQAKTMNRHITRSFEIPAGSITIFMVLSLFSWIMFYDRILVPLLARHGHAGGLSPKLRIGIGLLLSCFAMAISAGVACIRRRVAIEQGFEDQPNAVINMSALWMVPQCVVLGVAEALNSVGQVEYFYSQMPKTLSSVAVALYSFEMAVANLVGSIIVQMVNSITGEGNKTSWLDNNVNKGHLDYFYWLCAALALINFFGYLVCCWALGRQDKEPNEMEDFEYRNLPSS